MAKAAETAEKASGALSRGSTKEATENAKAGAAMLHELARQVKGELARDVAQELAMARDLADELAEREGRIREDAGARIRGRAKSLVVRMIRQVRARKGRKARTVRLLKTVRQGRVPEAGAGRPAGMGRSDRRRANRTVGGSCQDARALARGCAAFGPRVRPAIGFAS